MAAAWSGDSLELWATSDAGQSWARVAVLPGRAGPFARAMVAGPWDGTDSVLLATNDGVWVCRIPDGSLHVIETGAPVLDLLLDADGTLHAIFMKPADPESARHYLWATVSSGWQLVNQQRVTRFGDIPGAVAFEDGAAGQTILASGCFRAVHPAGHDARHRVEGGCWGGLEAHPTWRCHRPCGGPRLR